MSDTSVGGIEGAASLAFAMIRFQEAAAHPHLGCVPPGRPRIGIDSWVFAPSGHAIAREDVVPYLAALDSPALLYQTTTRGMVALFLLSELAPQRRAPAEGRLRNQHAALTQMAERFGLTVDSRILLQFDDEEHVFTLDVARIWAERFGVQVGWWISPLLNDRLAAGRMHLLRNDGTESWGDACPLEPKP